MSDDRLRSPLFQKAVWAIFILVATFGISSRALPETVLERLIVRGDRGDRVFLVEIADDESERSRGLSGRRSLKEDHGMLFLYESPREVYFWMYNTFIPLDIIFVRPDGTVHRVEPHAVPLSRTSMSSDGPVGAVLEISAGLAERYGINAGTRIIHQALPSSRE